MAWNGSDSEKVAIEAQGRNSRSKANGLRQGQERKNKFHSSNSTFNFNSKALMAGLIVVVLGGVAVWQFGGGRIPEVTQPEKTTTSRAIETAKPATVHKVESDRPQVDYSELSGKEIRRLPEDQTNNLNAAQLEYWKMFHPYPPPDENQPKWARSKTSIFKERVNNEIAFLVCAEPGTLIITPSDYDERFVKRFVRSLQTPIEIKADDSEYDKEIKQAVIAARKELKAAYDRGEDIAEIMNDSRDELQKYGQYRIEMEKSAVDALKRMDNPTDDDVSDLIKAANLTLEEKGIAPIDGNVISRTAIRMRRRQSIKEGLQQ